MSVAFFRTIHELESDSPRRTVWATAIVAVLLAVWAIWLAVARVAIYGATEKARLVGGKGYEADAAVAARVVAIHVSLGQQVKEGDVLVELDAGAERRQLDEDRTRLAVIGPQLAQLSNAIAVEEQALQSSRESGIVVVNEARVQWRGAESAWEVANQISKRYDSAGEVVPQIDRLRAQGEAEAARAKAEDLRLAIERLGRDQQMQASDRSSHIEQLKQTEMQLEGDQRTTKSEIARLEYEVEKHQIQAPISGRVAGLSQLRVGAFVHEGDLVATVVPRHSIMAVADFPPAIALGRIRPGQRAWLHLSAFPWTQYGTILATVQSVASEPILVNALGDPPDERIRVELQIQPESAPLIPIQYGLMGTAEVEVERISPAKLILREAGQTLTKPLSTSQVH
jgi:multidrug resistance efflux pump